VVDALVGRQTHQFVLVRALQQAQRGRVDEGDAAAAVHAVDTVAHRGEDELQALTLRLQPPLALAQVSPEHVEAMLRPALPPVILDARPEPVRQHEPYRLPRVRAVEANSLGEVDEVERNTVVYCVCPDHETARTLSRQMRDKGFKRVRAVKGGLDAWERRGYAVEPVPPERGRRREAPDDVSFEDGPTCQITLRGIA